MTIRFGRSAKRPALLWAIPRRDSTLVLMRGEFDLGARRELRDEVGSLLSTSPAEMVIDMAGVRFLDAGWSGVIAQLHHRVVRQGGGTIRISAVSPIARRVLDLCGLTSLRGLELAAPPAA